MPQGFLGATEVTQTGRTPQPPLEPVTTCPLPPQQSRHGPLHQGSFERGPQPSAPLEQVPSLLQLQAERSWSTKQPHPLREGGWVREQEGKACPQPVLARALHTPPHHPNANTQK